MVSMNKSKHSLGKYGSTFLYVIDEKISPANSFYLTVSMRKLKTLGILPVLIEGLVPKLLNSHCNSHWCFPTSEILQELCSFFIFLLTAFKDTLNFFLRLLSKRRKVERAIWYFVYPAIYPQQNKSLAHLLKVGVVMLWAHAHEGMGGVSREEVDRYCKIKCFHLWDFI